MIDVSSQFPLEPGWPRPDMSILGVTTTVIHHTAVEPNQGEALLLPAAQMSQADELNHIAVIHLYHKSLGWGGFGYHGITFPSGRSYKVTPLSRMGAHVGGNNGGKWGWALAGDFRDRLPGNAQIGGARAAVAELGKPIKPHNAYGGTTCPGRVVEILDRLMEDKMTDAEKVAFKALVARVTELEKKEEAQKNFNEHLGNVIGRQRAHFASLGAGDKHDYSVTIEKQ